MQPQYQEFLLASGGKVTLKLSTIKAVYHFASTGTWVYLDGDVKFAVDASYEAMVQVLDRRPDE